MSKKTLDFHVVTETKHILEKEDFKKAAAKYLLDCNDLEDFLIIKKKRLRLSLPTRLQKFLKILNLSNEPQT